MLIARTSIYQQLGPDFRGSRRYLPDSETSAWGVVLWRPDVAEGKSAISSIADRSVARMFRLLEEIAPAVGSSIIILMPTRAGGVVWVVGPSALFCDEGE